MFRFSLRGLLLTILFVAMTIGLWHERRQRTDIEARYRSLKIVTDSRIAVLTATVGALQANAKTFQLYNDSRIAMLKDELKRAGADSGRD